MLANNKAGFGDMPMNRPEMERRRWPGIDVGQIVAGVQQQWAGIGSRLGSCLEGGREILIERIPKFESHPLSVGILKWRKEMQRMGEEQRVNFLHHLATMSSIPERPSGRRRLPMFASLSTSQHPQPLFQLAMSLDQVSKRLDGVPVYTVSNSANEFILISDINSQKSLGIFCFRQEDAESLLSQVCDREPSLGRGAKVVAVSLDKVYQLNTEGIAFRFLPDPQQVKNALTQVKGKTGETRKAFDGVPIFQSENLILRSNNRRLCPIFFCKEDLERALNRAFKQQQRVNPSLKVNSDIQVGSFEDVLKRMETNEEESGWGDFVFIPPGIDAFSHLGKALAQGQGRESVVG